MIDVYTFYIVYIVLSNLIGFITNLILYKLLRLFLTNVLFVMFLKILLVMCHFYRMRRIYIAHSLLIMDFVLPDQNILYFFGETICCREVFQNCQSFILTWPKDSSSKTRSYFLCYYQMPRSSAWCWLDLYMVQTFFSLHFRDWFFRSCRFRHYSLF